MSLETLISAYGPPAVFAGCLLEGETAAILGGFIAHRAQGSGIGGPGMAVVAAAGAFLGDQLWFLVDRHAPDRGMVQRLRQKARDSRFVPLLHRHKIGMTLAFRFIPGLRIAGPVLLSQTNLRWPVYAVLNAASVAVWASLFTALGYHFGLEAEHLLGHLHPHHWFWLAGGMLALGLLAQRLLHRGRSGQQPPDQA